MCKYLAVVYTPRLCTASRSFRPQSLVQEVPVNCFVGNDGEIKEFGVGEENGLSPRQVLEARSAKKAKEDLQAEMKKYMQHAESDSSSFPQDQQQGQDPMIKGKRQLGSEPGKVLTFELGDELLKIVTENQAQDGQVNIAFEEDIEALTRRILEYRRRKGTNHDGPEKQPGQEDEEDEEHTEQHVFHHG